MNAAASLIINALIEKTILDLRDLSEQATTPEQFSIDCATIGDFSHASGNDIRQDKNFRELFIKLKAIEGPVLYWIEITSPVNKTDLVKAVRDYRESNLRSTSAVKNQVVEISDVLYVGKKKENFWRRVIEHLGYATSGQTGALQLFHWAPKLGLQLQFNYVAFPKELADFMPVLEYQFAKEMNPLIGKHK